MMHDLRAAAISAVYVLVVFLVAELARRAGMAKPSTRKIVHIGIGSWVVPTYFLFEQRWWAVAPAAGFVVFNALSYRYKLIASVEDDARNYGTILYPMSVAILLAITFDGPYRALGAAGVLAMTYGDAAASLVGRRFGRRIYRVAGHPRTLEGSAAMAVVSWLAMLAAFWLLGPRPDQGIVVATAVAALVVTGLEAISLWGVDNLLVPLGGAATLYLLRGTGWG